MPSVPLIDSGSVTGISGLEKRPVFFLTLHNSPTPSVVVKGDSDKDFAAVSIKWGSKLMKNVQNPLVNTKIMSTTEITAFKNAVLRYVRPGTKPRDFATGPFTWVKMPYVAGISDADFVDDQRVTVNLKLIRETILKLSDPVVWRELGIVVAVDIFNGNSDRFVVERSDTRNPGTWANRGNIMFIGGGHGHTTKVIGLDTFDPNAPVNNLQAGGGFEGLKVLINPSQRDQFAGEAVKSVGKQMQFWLRDSGHNHFIKMAVQGADGPEVRTIELNTMDRLFEAYSVDFVQGIAAGAVQLKAYLDRKVLEYGVRLVGGPLPQRTAPPLPGMPPTRPRTAPGAQAPARRTIPQGVLDRMKYLGWL